MPILWLRKNIGCLFYENEKELAIELDYTNSSLAMTFVLPKKGCSLPSVIDNLNPDFLSTKNYKNDKIIIAIPKFSFSSKFELSKELDKMGMPNAFDRNKANFIGITNQPKIEIDKIIHKSFISINEKGTEAGAATALEMGGGASEGLPKEFIADRPFIILISEKSTGNILFMGTVMNPNQQ
jgi:serpin B